MLKRTGDGSGGSRLRRALGERASPATGVRAAIAILAGAVIVAVTNAAAIAITVSLPRGGLGLRAAHHLFDLVQTLGIGAAAAVAIGLFAALVPLPLWASLGLYAVAGTALMDLILGPHLRLQASLALDGRLERLLFGIYLGLCGLAAPAAHLIGSFFARFRWLRAAPIAASLGSIVANHGILRDDYPGVHGAIAWIAATLAGAALAPSIHVRLSERATPRSRAALAAAAAFVAASSVLIAPPNSVRIELFREPGASAAWIFASTIWSLPDVPEGPPSPTSPWFADRSTLPAVPSTDPPLITRPPVVVLITIDAMRADVVDDAQNDHVFPTIADLKRTSAYFERATSAGSQTSVSLTTLFTGRYFSELFWRMHGAGESRFEYPAADPSPRFPELLTARGVRTSSFCSLKFLAGEYGVARGFAEEHMIASGRSHARAKPVIDPLIERLRSLKADEPAFLYAHLTEPHAPYDRGGRKASDKESYIAEIGVADAELARVVRLLSQRFPDRGVLLVSSDHGEAFGEHETTHHTKTLYEEVLRVPLLIRGPGVRPRRIRQHVGLIDVGPTILDIFGVDTPSSSMGQSLVPLLRGEDKALTRPILAEGRLRRALYAGRLKVIEDARRKVVEVYDLDADPLELGNLFPVHRVRAEEALGALRAFFAEHEARAPGYRVPYKP